MPILDQDVAIYVSERLTDFSDGGGRITSTPMIDGQSNNIYPDQSDLDETYGRLQLRKVGPAVKTDNTDTYLGGRFFISKPPVNKKVSVTAYQTGKNRHFDERLDAQRWLESYLTAGSESRYKLLGDQLRGQRMIFTFGKTTTPAPEIGTAFCLESLDDGTLEFVRVTDVSSEVRIYEDDKGEFARQIFILSISAPLKNTFIGAEVQRYDHGIRPNALLRVTQIADAAKYAGIQPITTAANIGEMTVKAESLFSQLVPSSTVETPAVDVLAGTNQAALVKCGGAITVSSTPINGGVVSFGRPFVPGTLTSAIGVDNGKGELIQNGVKRGDIDYPSGTISGLNNTGVTDLTAEPAVALNQSAHTQSRRIQATNRGYVYTFNLRPIPEKRSVFIDYMSQGNWYRIQVNTNGELRDDVGSVATLDAVTGSLIITLAALPDIDTEVIVYFASPAHYQIVAGVQLPSRPHIEHRISQGTVAPGSLVVSWQSGGDNKSATDDNTGGITGDASGFVIYAGGYIYLLPNADAIPDPNSVISIDYSDAQAVTETLTPNQQGEFTLSHAPTVGTLTASWSVQTSTVRDAVVMGKPSWFEADNGIPPRNVYSYDRTTGIIQRTATDNGSGSFDFGGTIAGTTVTLTPTAPVDSYAYQDGAWSVDQTVTETLIGGVTFSYLPAATAQNTHTETLTAPAIAINLNPKRTDATLPGSVIFEWNGVRYQDFEGKILRDVQPGTNIGTEAGTIDYQTGLVTLTNWVSGAGDLELLAMLTTFGQWTTTAITFRTTGAPIRPGSLFVRAVTADGDAINGTTNTGGQINTAEINGTVNQEVGITSLTFSEAVDPSSIRYNCVVYSTLPLDADILGVDPVRLPIDGRVPIFRKGDVAIVHHTATENLGTVAAGQSINLPQTRLTWLHINDADGQRVPNDRYTADLDAGTIVFPDPLNLSGYAQPLSAEFRIHDQRLIVDVEISGVIALAGQLTHNYPANESYISSAVIIGDLQARVTNVFDQMNWTGEWSDTLIGSATSAEFNNKSYPIEVTNRGAITERWFLEITNSGQFRCIGETVGQIGLGTTTEVFAPLNPEEQVPYFVIDPLAWGSGWPQGSILRFNTIGANDAVWLAKTTQQGANGIDSESFVLEQIGNANKD